MEEGLIRATAIACLVIVSPTQAEAQASLWRTLAVGDDPDIAKTKLSAMAEVKRTKIKIKRGISEGLDVEMMGPGIQIFDGQFQLNVVFKNRQLTEVHLASGTGCARDGFTLYNSIGKQLAEKYSQELIPLADRARFDLTMLEADVARATILKSAWTNGETTALLSIRFEQTSPPRYFGGTALNRSLYELSRALYDNAAANCGGAYYRTGKIEITYISKSDFDQRQETSRSEAEAASKAAADAL